MTVVVSELIVLDENPGVITQLTERAVQSTFYQPGMSAEQVAANQRIIDIAHDCCLQASSSSHQAVFGAWVSDVLAGFVISTLHGPADRELDWLMVDPRFQGRGLAQELMVAGLSWLDPLQPIWLNVIRYNNRAIRFYEGFGFAIDETAQTNHVVPHAIMRRQPQPLGQP